MVVDSDNFSTNYNHNYNQMLLQGFESPICFADLLNHQSREQSKIEDTFNQFKKSLMDNINENNIQIANKFETQTNAIVNEKRQIIEERYED